ncbi:hypothetical protein QUF72_06300, partial [Desulfobacterales bacterium HSG2]|nr:hypothetical protein [Desulfobacterales bacterium HSG2]
RLGGLGVRLGRTSRTGLQIPSGSAAWESGLGEHHGRACKFRPARRLGSPAWENVTDGIANPVRLGLLLFILLLLLLFILILSCPFDKDKDKEQEQD